jgi:hypothetical protein
LPVQDASIKLASVRIVSARHGASEGEELLKVLICFLFVIILFSSGCDRGQYYDIGSVLIDKEMIRGPNTYPEPPDTTNQ